MKVVSPVTVITLPMHKMTNYGYSMMIQKLMKQVKNK
jgi:hypothetical protein